MLCDYNIHTDLALEDKERFEEDNVEISGVSVEEFCNEESGISVTEVKILNENGAKMIGKPIGNYITLEIENLAVSDEEYQMMIAKEIAYQIKKLLETKTDHYTVLVAGLGNRNVTPDTLGPCVIDKLKITRHIIKEFGRDENSICAITPGVMAQTGMESAEIIKAVVEEVNPDFVVVIDALAARNTKRLNKTIQIADTGIHPGSGVGNHRNAITKETLKVPVIAIGIPTVVDAATIVRDAGCEKIASHLYGMFVTPKDIDESIEQISTTIAAGLNECFQSHNK